MQTGERRFTVAPATWQDYGANRLGQDLRLSSQAPRPAVWGPWHPSLKRHHPLALPESGGRGDNGAQKRGLDRGRMASECCALQRASHRCGLGPLEGGCPMKPRWGGNSRRNTQESGWRSHGPAGAGWRWCKRPAAEVVGVGISCRERAEGRAQAVRVDG